MEMLDTDMGTSLTKGEEVLKIFGFKNYKVAATSKRLIIKKLGFMSKDIQDFAYEHISSVHFFKQIPWRTILFGAILALLGLAVRDELGGFLLLIGLIIAVLGYLSTKTGIQLHISGYGSYLIESGEKSRLDELLKIIREKR